MLSFRSFLFSSVSVIGGSSRVTGTPPVPTLRSLSLSATAILEGTANATVIAGILGARPGSVITITNTSGGRFALSGTNITAGATATNFEAATSHSITLRETNAAYPNSPRDTVITIDVTNVLEAASLNALTLSATAFTEGTSSSGAIAGATAGSTIAASGLPTGLTINGAARTWAWDGTGAVGTPAITLTETLADSPNSPRETVVPLTIEAGAALFAVSTPLLFEGDSNTDWLYGLTPNWAKRTLVKTNGRFYLPVGGDIAQQGATVGESPGAGSNSMQGRQAATVAKISSLVSRFGECILWFQIGTNGSSDATGDVAKLAATVNAYKSAGATVFCNLAPEFFVSAYRTTLNSAIIDGTIPVDGYVNPNGVIIQSAGKTHYVSSDSEAVAELVSAFLLERTVTDTIYDDPIVGFTVDTMAGTGGTPGVGGTGQLPTGWTGARVTGGNATAVYSVSGPDAEGLFSVDIAVTAGTTATTFTLTKNEPMAFAAGDVVDGGATVQIVSATDRDSIDQLFVRVAQGDFPKNTGAIDTIDFAGPAVWRTYPINQAASGSTFAKSVQLRVAAGKSATVRVKGFFHVIRENSASIAPFNTAAPVMGVCAVGASPICSNGTWTGTPAPTFTQQFYLGELPIASNYVFQAGDEGGIVTCSVRATNTAGAINAVSNAVGVVVLDTTAPTITSSAGVSVVENEPLAHALTANEAVTWTIRSAAQSAASVDSAQFEISGSTLRFSSNGTRDFEAPADTGSNNTYVVVVRATDAAGNFTEQTITTTVTDVADAPAPVITSSASVSVAENAALTHTLSANESVTWTIRTAGENPASVDAAQFEISGFTLRFNSNGTRNFEAPSDSDGNNTYVVVLRATNTSGNFVEQTFTATVTDVAEATAPVWNTTVNFGNPAQLTYSNADRTVSNNLSTSGARFARQALTPGKTSGKWYAKLTLTGGGASRGLGVGTNAIGGSVGGTNGTSRWYWVGTTAFTNSSGRAMGSNISTADGTYEVAVDLDLNLMWLRAEGGLWNGSGTADPATGADGLSISGRLTNELFIILSHPANTTATSTFISGTPPAGFTGI